MILAHPVMQALIEAKWKYIRMFFYVRLALYILFLLIWSGLIVYPTAQEQHIYTFPRHVYRLFFQVCFTNSHYNYICWNFLYTMVNSFETTMLACSKNRQRRWGNCHFLIPITTLPHPKMMLVYLFRPNLYILCWLTLTLTYPACLLELASKYRSMILLELIIFKNGWWMRSHTCNSTFIYQAIHSFQIKNRVMKFAKKFLVWFLYGTPPSIYKCSCHLAPPPPPPTPHPPNTDYQFPRNK